MKVLVTGASGFLGQHIAKQLLDAGHEVTNFSRSTPAALTEIGISTINGNIRNYDDIQKASSGFDAIIHTASLVAMWGKWEDFRATNIDGTNNVIQACIENNINKLVYTSTPSVVFGNKSLTGVDESTPYPKKYLADYAKSKAAAEKNVLHANSEKLMTVALRPHLIFGSDDKNLIPRLLSKFKKSQLLIIGDGENTVDVIHVKNAAFAHILALESLKENSPSLGQAYFLGQERPVNLWNFINAILKQYNLGPIDKKISSKKAYFIATLIEFTYKFFKITKHEPPLTRFMVKQFTKSHYFNHQKSLNDLGNYYLLNIEDALKELNYTKHSSGQSHEKTMLLP